MRPLILILMFFFSSAELWAQAAKTTGPGMAMQILPFLIMFFIFYFLVMRPQVKKQKVHLDFLGKLKRGDRVLTSSGIFGTIEGLTDKFVTLEVADGVRIRILKSSVAQPVKEG